MFLEENEIRRALSHRSVSGGKAAWPRIREEIGKRPPPSRVGTIALMTVAVVLLLAAAASLRQAPPYRPAREPSGFRVSRVETRGRPSPALILQPDKDTLVVVIPD